MSKLRLDSVEWKEFFIGGEEGLFNIRSTKSGIDKNKLLENKGNIPYITRSNLNNGIDMFVGEKQNIRFSIDEGNVITIGLDTQTVFYQPKSFFTGQNIQIVENKFLNKEIALFLVPLLKIQMQKFSWGSTGATLTRLNRTKILLPIDSNGNPNWQFMEDYIKQAQKIQAQKIANYYEQRMIECGFELLGLEDVEWKEFYLTELFDIKRGNQNNMGACKDGDIPLISAKKVDNGYKTFISDNGKEIFEENILTLNNDGDGGVGMAFYQPHHMALDTHVTALIPELSIDKYSLLFLSRVTTNQRDKFSHGYSINNSRLQKQKIILPADENGNPHWEYMRKFMHKLESENLSKVLEYIYIYI